MKYEDLQGEFKKLYDEGSWQSWRIGLYTGFTIALGFMGFGMLVYFVIFLHR